jgi:hypothetical protein
MLDRAIRDSKKMCIEVLRYPRSSSVRWWRWNRGNDFRERRAAVSGSTFRGKEGIYMLLLIIILVLVLGGGGGYYGHSRWGYGGGAGVGLGTILLILLIAYMLGIFH